MRRVCLVVFLAVSGVGCGSAPPPPTPAPQAAPAPVPPNPCDNRVIDPAVNPSATDEAAKGPSTPKR